jgi:hypothetical protein
MLITGTLETSAFKEHGGTITESLEYGFKDPIDAQISFINPNDREGEVQINVSFPITKSSSDSIFGVLPERTRMVQLTFFLYVSCFYSQVYLLEYQFSIAVETEEGRTPSDSTTFKRILCSSTEEHPKGADSYFQVNENVYRGYAESRISLESGAQWLKELMGWHRYTHDSDRELDWKRDR